MKEYMQPEVELVQFTSESITDIGVSDGGKAETNTFTDDDIVMGP